MVLDMGMWMRISATLLVTNGKMYQKLYVPITWGSPRMDLRVLFMSGPACAPQCPEVTTE